MDISNGTGVISPAAPHFILHKSEEPELIEGLAKPVAASDYHCFDTQTKHGEQLIRPDFPLQSAHFSFLMNPLYK
jgi:hypothetical protein